MAPVSFRLHTGEFGALEAACPVYWWLIRPSTGVVSMISRRPSVQGQAALLPWAAACTGRKSGRDRMSE